MSSSFVLLVIVVMDSSSIFILVLLMFLRWQVYCQGDLPVIPSTSAETQYLTFDMDQHGPDGGIFSSPNFPNYYPQETILFYRFIASSDYRVQIEIDFFQIRGVTPQCTHDYLDVYINVTSFDQDHGVVNDHLHRYCGRNKPPLLVSYTNLLLLGFFTEDTLTERGFNGSFRFIPVQPYRKNLVQEPCDYLFNSSIQKRGELFSSTYPGTYLPWQFCNYSFVGQPGERVHIRFRDLMLFKTPNTQHCAVDLIKLYDNTLDSPQLRRSLSGFRQTATSDYPFPSEQVDPAHITDLCGTISLPLDFYSTGQNLLLYFIATHYAELTDDEQMQMSDSSGPLWRKGFYAEYEFLSSLTRLDFVSISKSNEYIPGTECDQTIRSFGQGYGKLQSPNWPHPYKPQTSCSTHLLGLDDRYTLENVEIEFDQFDIDCQLASLVLYDASRISDHQTRSRPSVSASSASMISKKTGSFSNYYRQELDFKANLSFCGHFKPEGRFVSKNAELKLSFIPNDHTSRAVLPSLINGGKFQARYRFVKSYHEVSADEYDGTNPASCNLSYYQSYSLTGIFEPPRSSENDYFSNSNCTFTFYSMTDDSRLLIWYDYFNIADEDYVYCPSDNLTYTYSLYGYSESRPHPFIYCGYKNFPPPYLTMRSTKQFRVHFRSNDDSEAGIGFNGRYLFLNRSNASSSWCRSPFSPVYYVNETEEMSGNISSDGYPENVVCEWSFLTRSGLQFNIEINKLELEGSKTKDPPQGCQSSVLRIISGRGTDELCGQYAQSYYILTKANWFTLQFISLTRQTKEPLLGFELYWTIVQNKVNLSDGETRCLSQDFFDCQKGSNATDIKPFCIHRSLVCDERVHCRPLSDGDESQSNCHQKIPSRPSAISNSNRNLSSYAFIRHHIILIITILILCLTLLLTAMILVFLLTKIKQRRDQSRTSKIHNSHDAEQQQQRRRRQKKDDQVSLKKKSTQICLVDRNDADPIEASMMEQTVTTV